MHIKRNVPIMLVLICTMLFLSACGHQIPQASQEMLGQKKSVLVISPPGLKDEAKHAMDSALNDWRNKDRIAWKWLQEKPSFDADTVKAIEQTDFDQIIVLGSELFGDALKTAKQFPAKKWTLLQQVAERNPTALQMTDNAAVWQADPANFNAQMNTWVTQQLKAKLPIMWVTTTAYPIPVAWAPSEEADQVVAIDAFGPSLWYQQLQVQAQQIGAKWIVLYAPEAAAEKMKIQNLHVQMLDMTNAVQYQLNWTAILQSVKERLTKDAWKAGQYAYSAEEAAAVLK